MIDGNFEITTAAVTDRGLSEKRPQNEDSYLSLPEHGVFAVADGVGGAMAGDVASQMAVEILGEAFINYSATADPEEIMTVAIDRANTAINQMASELPQLSSMATTIVALHVSGNIATIAHVGDSRAYRLDSDGHLYRETSDHSVVEEEVRAGRMTPEQAANHPSRNVISRAVGAELTVDIDIKTIILEPGTTFLLCSDGITRHIPDQEIAELLTTGMSLEQVCSQMKEMCYSRGAEDNLTAVIVKTGNEINGSVPTSPTVENLSEEEQTIAAARSPFENYADASIPLTQTAESTSVEISQTDKTPAAPDDEAYLIQPEPHPAGSDASDVETETAEYSSSQLIVPASVPHPTPHAEREFSMFGETPTVNAAREPTSVNNGNSLFRSLIYLALGTVIGALGVYLLTPSQPEPAAQSTTVQDLAPKSGNVPASTLEELRWNVDKDPEAYVRARAASPKDATDHYILGRALFLAGNAWEAEQQFKIVESRKSEIEPAQSAISILADIAMMRAISTTGPADVKFKTLFGEVRKNTVDSNTASNSSISSNTNTGQ